MNNPELVVAIAGAVATWLVKNKYVNEKTLATAKRILIGGDSATDVTDQTRMIIGEALDLKKKLDNQPEKNLINKLIGLIETLLRGWLKAR
jgi:hypothetical protein